MTEREKYSALPSRSPTTFTTDGSSSSARPAIGEAAGYSRGLPTHLFGSKADLFARVIHWISDKMRQQVAAKYGIENPDQLRGQAIVQKRGVHNKQGHIVFASDNSTRRKVEAVNRNIRFRSHRLN